MKALALFIPLLLLQSHPGTKPVPRDAAWLKRHEGFVAEARNGNIEVLFMGDSITDGWRKDPQLKIWQERFAPLKAANFGISGDRTQHVLWRLQNGEFEGCTPKVVCLMIGTNNIGGSAGAEPAASAIEGVRAIVKEILTRSPQTKVLLQAVFPRAERADHPHRATIKEINAAIAGLDDGGKTVKFIDFGDKFLQPDGTLTKEVMPDFLHLSERGYRIWADAIQAPLAEMVKP